MLDRAAALLDDDHERLLATATAFETAGCPYQRARTLILAGRDSASTGNAALVDLGLTLAIGHRLTVSVGLGRIGLASGTKDPVRPSHAAIMLKA